jgi:predicted  nucleic acid-binding Zn-ribbon protein
MDRLSTLSRLYRQLEKYETEIADIERDLADFEGQLERFQPKIDEMNAMTNKPHRDFHSYHQSKAYNDYRAYLKEKDRLERNIQNYKDILEERNEEKRPTEEKIREMEEKIKEIEMTDSNTIQSANFIRMASQMQSPKEKSKTSRPTLHPVSRLSAQGPYFRNQFVDRMERYADVPGALHRKGVTRKPHYPFGGKRNRTRMKNKKTSRYGSSIL